MSYKTRSRMKSILNKDKGITKRIDSEIAETIRTVDRLEKEMQEMSHQIRLLL